MSTDIGLRGTTIPYGVKRVPKDKKNKDWTKSVVQSWMVVDPDEIVDDYRLADYSKALHSVWITSPDADHSEHEDWVQGRAPVLRSGQTGAQAGIVERGGQGSFVSSGVILTCGHVVAETGGNVRVVSTRKRNTRVTPSTTIESNAPRKHVMQITGELLARDEDCLEIAWYGGDQFSVSVNDTVGFETILPGTWFNAVIVRLSNGVVQQALLTQIAEPQKAMSEEELEQAYSELPAANLEPAD